tara:strand:- start:395 stop:622 length:228 start_codon:yes stop_codon:yes gene_type:complete
LGQFIGISFVHLKSSLIVFIFRRKKAGWQDHVYASKIARTCSSMQARRLVDGPTRCGMASRIGLSRTTFWKLLLV